MLLSSGPGGISSEQSADPVSKSTSCFVAISLLAMSSGLAGQTVVVGDNILFGPVTPDPFTGENHSGTIFQDSAGSDPTSVLFEYDGSNLTAVAWNLDEESDWYVVEPGAAFGFATLASGQFTPIFTLDHSYGPVFVGSSEFYLSVSTP